MKRDTMERLVLLPFSHGCISESSVAIGHRVPHPRRAKPNNNNSNTSLTSTKEEEEEEEEESLWSLENNNMKNSSKSLAPSKSNGFHRLCRSFKTISQLFVYKEEELEELASEMEIGVPTDVKHVTHIGLDGPANNINPIQSCFHGWDSLVSPHQLSTPSPPLGQFDINMPAQFNPALVRTSSC